MTWSRHLFLFYYYFFFKKRVNKIRKKTLSVKNWNCGNWGLEFGIWNLEELFKWVHNKLETYIIINK